MNATANMPDMGKKKPTPATQPVEDDGVQIAVRLVSNAMLRALDKVAKRAMRSRNLMINFIIEEYLKASGEWPPKS